MTIAVAYRPDEFGRAAIDWAEEEHLVVVPKCPFANSWLRKHPDEAARVDIDWAAAESVD